MTLTFDPELHSDQDSDFRTAPNRVSDIDLDLELDLDYAPYLDPDDNIDSNLNF